MKHHLRVAFLLVLVSTLQRVRTCDAAKSESLAAIRVNLSASAVSFPHVWRATGWCPPGNKSSEAIERYALSESSWQNHAFIRASDGVDIVRVHDLLFLLDVDTGTSPTNMTESQLDPTRLDAVLDMLVRDHEFDLGFEIMGNPGGIFSSWKDPDQIESWRRMVVFVASRYIERYGIDAVRRWRWEGWNEPDHACNEARKMDANIDCDVASWLRYFFDACAAGVREADPSLTFGGPGTGGATLNTPFLAKMLKRAVDEQSTNRRVDFVQWHEKGVLPRPPTKPSNTVFDRDVCELAKKVAPSVVSRVPLGNEEIDPAGDWSASYDWRGDATYPAAIARTIAMHLHVIVDGESGVTWGYHANDNAFLNYGDRWFSQRTLTARFFMNQSVSRDGTTPVVEIIRKPALNLMKILSLLGDERLVSSAVSSVGVPGYGSDPTRYPVGLIATRRRRFRRDNDSVTQTRWERSVLLFGSDGTETCNGTTCDTKLTITLSDLPSATARSDISTVLVHYIIDQENGNVMKMWQSMGGASNPFPSAEQFVLLRDASELVALERVVINSTPFDAVRVNVTLKIPSIHLFHVCGGGENTTSATSLEIRNVSIRLTPTASPPTVLVRWSPVEERCVSTYEVLWRPHDDTAATRVNGVNTIHRIFVHAQAGRNVAAGCYSIRAVDYWSRAGPASGEACL